jgi:alpha-1,3-rhamnosyl/mannosyltransferase
LRIGIDVGRALRGRDGVATYSRQLARGLIELDRSNELRLFDLDGGRCRAESVGAVLGDLPANVRVADATRSEVAELDLFHCTAYRLPPPGARRLLFTVHDLTFLSHPEFHTLANRVRCLTSMAQGLARGSAVVAVSETARGECERLLALDHASIEVIPPAVSPLFCPSEHPTRDAEVASGLGVTKPFVLNVGSLEPRKNLAGVLDGLAALPDGLAHDLLLVVVASEGWRDREIRRRLDPMIDSGSAVLVGDLSEEELVALYRTAEVMLYPSLVEGFGLPLVEAMACGTPVVTSNRSSMPEVAGDAALLVNPDDPRSIASGVTRAVRDAETRNRLIATGLDRSRDYASETVTSRVLELYRRLVGAGL